MDWHDRIAIDAGVLGGKPVVRGTRITVELIVDLLGQAWTLEQLVEEYPGVTPDDVRACLRYASEILRSENVYALEA